MSSTPVYFVSHGGGPWPWMHGEFRQNFALLEQSLQSIGAEIGAPRALVVVTAHWEAPVIKVSCGSNPGMLYDYSGFPPETYDIQYPAPGAPEVAADVLALLQSAGIDAEPDTTRGYDHGTFTTLAPMFPMANVPVVQMSINSNYNAQDHLLLGKALAPLRAQGIVIIGSGLSYHNLPILSASLRNMGSSGAAGSKAFDQWVNEAVNAPPEERWSQFLHWYEVPSATVAHPEPDHFLPMLVAVGAAGSDAAVRNYHEETFAGYLSVSSFRFGELTPSGPLGK